MDYWSFFNKSDWLVKFNHVNSLVITYQWYKMGIMLTGKVTKFGNMNYLILAYYCHCKTVAVRTHDSFNSGVMVYHYWGTYILEWDICLV